MELTYNTRDAKGNEIIKMIPIKEFPIVDDKFTCQICHKEKGCGVLVKKAVSADFTDWAYVGEKICVECSRLFSLHFYSYIVENNQIQLMNVRQIRNTILRKHETPFKIVIAVSKKKHLFYRSVENYSDEYFSINLETESILTNRERMKFLFDFVENLLVLGATKSGLTNGEIPYNILMKTGMQPLKILQQEITGSREIQIPLYCAQKPDISEEDALCNMDLIRKM